MKRAGAWLAALAIGLHALWPLIANARPDSVERVPVCTVEGVTHYLELPGGKTPLEQSSAAHHEHCSFCFLGERPALLPSFHFLSIEGAASGTAPSSEYRAFDCQPVVTPAARAPPGSPWVRRQPTTKENDETVSDLVRHGDGALAARPR